MSVVLNQGSACLESRDIRNVAGVGMGERDKQKFQCGVGKEIFTQRKCFPFQRIHTAIMAGGIILPLLVLGYPYTDFWKRNYFAR